MTDRIKSGEIKIEYCPTLDMIGDYFTKPLQGSLFRKSCKRILGIEEADVTKYNTKEHEWIKEREHNKYTLTNIIKACGWDHMSVLVSKDKYQKINTW